MQYIILAAFAAAVFGICYLIDKEFKKLFRNQVQHQSGLAVKANKRYGIFGVILSLLGIVGIINGVAGETVLLVGGIIVLLMGIALGIYYISFGIYYDDDSFLLSSFGKKTVTYRYQRRWKEHKLASRDDWGVSFSGQGFCGLVPAKGNSGGGLCVP